MRNNEERMRASAHVAEVAQLVEKNANAKSPTNPIEAPSPTVMVDLPSKGQFYPQVHLWNNRESVEMRFMTAKEEDILSNKSFLQKGIAFDKLLKNLLVDKMVDIDSILLCDKSALILAARISGYGSEYKIEIRCPSCEKKIKHVFDLDLFENVFLTEEKLESCQVQLTEAKTFLMELPRTQKVIEFKLMNGADEKKLTNISENKKKQNLPDSSVTDTMKQFILSVDHDDDRSVVNKFVETMPAFDSKFLRRIYSEISPKVDNTQSFKCADCEETSELEVPLTTEFFWFD